MAYILRDGCIVCLTDNLLMGNTLFPAFAIKTNVVINVLQTFGIDYQGRIIDSKCCCIALRKGFIFTSEAGKYPFPKTPSAKVDTFLELPFIPCSFFYLVIVLLWELFIYSTG